MKIGRNHTVDILGVQVGTQTRQGLIQFISDSIENGNRIVIAYINIYTLNLSLRHPWFKDFLNQAAMTYCDGYGVKLGGKLLCHRIPERYTAPDWLPELAYTCAKNEYSMFILGAQPGIAEKAARSLKDLYSQLVIVGTHHGYFDKSAESNENIRVIQLLNSLQIDILVLGLGTPLQEKWITENWSRLNCRVVLPVGAALDYLAGEAWRAPLWITDHGFEWLGRLISNPKRFWKRYLIGIPNFFVHVIRQRLRHTWNDRFNHPHLPITLPDEVSRDETSGSPT